MALFYIALFVVVGIFFAAMLIYGTREKSFEQAIEEQRNKNNFDLLLSGGKAEQSSKKETNKKSKKVKETGAKKNKEKSAVSQAPGANNKSVATKEPSVAKVASTSRTASTTSTFTASAPKEVENVPVKVEAVISHQPDVVDQAPIMVSTAKAPHHVKEQTSKEAKQKAASKQSSQKQQTQLQQQPPQQKVTTPEVVAVIEKVATPLATTAPEPPQPKASNTKKGKRAVSKASPKELSFEDILELVNSSYFSADDITRLTDALLNRQADDSNADYNWHKKNDPLEALQKQLLEKKELIDQQAKNIEAAKKKSEMVLVDIAVLKKTLIRQQNDNDQLRKEIEFQKNSFGSSLRESELKAHQKYEQRFIEVRAEERTRLAHEIGTLKSEIARLNDLVSAQSSGIKDHENNLDELIAQNQQLKEKYNELTKNLAEADGQFQQAEAKLSAVNGAHQKEVEAFRTQIQQLVADKEVLETQVQEGNNANSCEIENYTLDIKNLKAELSESVAKREEAEISIAELKTQNVSISKEKTAALHETDSLRTQLSQLESEKESIAAKLESITSEKDSLSYKSDDLNNLIKFNDEKLENLTSAFQKLGLSIDSDNLHQSIDSLKTKASKYDELSSKNSDLSELLEQLSNDNETLKAQLDSLKQDSKEEAKKSQEYASTLVETEKLLNDLQEKVLKSKSEENGKTREFEELLTQRGDELASISDELAKCREEIDNLNTLNADLKVQLRDLKLLVKELGSSKEAQLSSFKSKEEEVRLDMEKIKEENKNLNSKIVKLNNLVQIGKHSFQEESEKVQNLESLLMNGKENNNNSGAHASNGNGSS